MNFTICAIDWHSGAVALHQQNDTVMNANDTLSRLSAMFASDESLVAMIDLVDELDLEIMDIKMA